MENEIKLGYKGFIHPTKQEEVVPALKKMISSAMEHLNKCHDVVSTKDVLDFLQLLMETTEPSTGYF